MIRRSPKLLKEINHEARHYPGCPVRKASQRWP